MSYLNYINGSNVADYVNVTETSVASIIFKGTIFKVFSAPTVAYFSSRGLNSQSRGVLKPDILALGVNILSTWPTQTSPTRNENPINDEQHNKASFFDMGADNVNPSKAMDPGLVYDIKPDDYVRFLCELGYSDKQVVIVTH
ncbi:subtilisin-like protease [Curcuma longa]|uniref:subtilisin-like protease n=1 Tax=Curcuma longa TaxID=136217 RepID=UPI003D9F1D5F